MPRNEYGTVRIEYDDDVLQIINKINKTLKSRDLVLEDDMQEHDGFIIMALREIEEEPEHTEPVAIRKCECGKAIYTEYGFCGGCGR